MKNWKDYLADKFADTERFFIEAGMGYAFVVKDRTGKSSTEITITCGDSNYLELADVRFRNPESPGWTLYEDTKGPVFEIFDPEYRSRVDDWLDIPLKHGWIEEKLYVDGEHVRSVVSFRRGTYKARFSVNMLPEGCLVFLFGGLIYHLRILGRRVERRKVFVEPMLL